MARKRKPELIDTSGLRDYSLNHVRYEAWMFFSVADLFTLPFDAGSQELAFVLRNVVIEGIGNHARNLIDFFYPRDTVKDNDVIAADYFPRGVLPSTFPSINDAQTLECARRRADKELAHLTTARMSGAPPEKQWPTQDIAAELLGLLQEFVMTAEHIHPDLKAYIETRVAEQKDRSTSMPCRAERLYACIARVAEQ